MSTPLDPGTADTESRSEIVFFQALKKNADDREAFLNQECGSDPRMREEVEGLLRDHEKAGSFLSGSAPAAAELEAEFGHLKPEQVGASIGPYKLLEQIGEGGCGVVFMAEQEKPVRRRVALKVIKLGMDTKQVIARFEAERQALALMDHPNIARVLDAGATETGRPYFVMELVRGVRITDYCDQNNLPTAKRLALFTQVCQAIQHAHQKGIIHRDIKPSNILVTLHDGVPVPKVIDFGIAKATTGQRLTDMTVFTAFEQFIGTPAYMSPEQAEMSGLDIDTRSDIYALGVLLYELLTSQTPFDAEALLASGLDAMRRTIREQDPPRPSTRLSTLLAADLSTVARHHQSESGKLTHSISGDLDWIVMKALEKDRTRRYETASGLALDVQRHLDDEPVTARPAGKLYRLRKLVRRNKVAFAAAGAVLAALLIGLGVSTWMFFKQKDALERAIAAEKEQSRLRQVAEIEGTRAINEANKSGQVARFLRDMLMGVGPSVAQGRDTTLLREILDQTAERIGTNLKDQPEVEVELRAHIGKVYDAIGDYEKAAAMLTSAFEIAKKLRGEEHAEIVYLLNARALVLAQQGEMENAETMLREALAIDRKLAGEGGDVSTSLNNLALILGDRGKFEEAEKIHREALAMSRRLIGDESDDVASSLSNLAVVLQQQQKFDEAETALRESLAIRKELFGNVHPAVAATLNNLAGLVQQQNKLEESETLFRELLPMQRKLLGDAHPNVAAALNGLGLAILKQDRAAEAEPFLREAVEIERKARKSPHPQTANIIGNLGRVMEGEGNYEEAESLYREALAIFAQFPGPDHPAMTSWRNRLQLLLQSQGKPIDADKADPTPVGEPAAGSSRH